MNLPYDLVAEPDRCYQAVVGRDGRFDGVFYTGVHTTGIYCRPSCPAATPRRRNVSFHRTAAGAQAAGFRACRRCRPDLTPGSPEWDIRGDLAGRAMRMIADGLVEREGVTGLAARSGYTSRHLSRVLTEQLGAGPLALARAQRAHTARILIETTAMRFADVAFAAGFSSVRQFNATMQEIYASNPSDLRSRCSRRPGHDTAPGIVSLSLPVREPFDSAALLAFLRLRLVPGIEEMTGTCYRRTIRLTHGVGTVELTPGTGGVSCRLALADLRDLPSAVERCRRLLDLDTDPVAIDAWLSTDPLLAPGVARRPGLRVPGHVDGFEVAVRAVVGQQVSVRAARTVVARLVQDFGEPSTRSAPSPTSFPPRRRSLTPTRTRCRCRWRAADVSSGSPGPSPKAPSYWIGALPAPMSGARCSPCPASGSGRPTTSPFGRSGTRTSSWTRISARAVPSRGCLPKPRRRLLR